MQAFAFKKDFNYRKFIKTAEKVFVLVAWIAVYIGLYFATKDSPAAHQLKAHSVDRMGLLPPYGNQTEDVNSNASKGENYVR